MEGDFRATWNNTYREDRFGEVNDYTGFANGEEFEAEEQVREYFTRKNMFDLLNNIPPEEIPCQESLDEMAEMVIKYRWHMKD